KLPATTIGISTGSGSTIKPNAAGTIQNALTAIAIPIWSSSRPLTTFCRGCSSFASHKRRVTNHGNAYTANVSAFSWAKRTVTTRSRGAFAVTTASRKPSVTVRLISNPPYIAYEGRRSRSAYPTVTIAAITSGTPYKTSSLNHEKIPAAGAGTRTPVTACTAG